MPNEPLDPKILDHVQVEEDSLLEIVHSRNSGFSVVPLQLNPTFADWSDLRLEESLASHKGYLKQLRLKETGKLEKKIAEFERELAARKKGPNTENDFSSVKGKLQLMSEISPQKSDYHGLSPDCGGRWEKPHIRSNIILHEVQSSNTSKEKTSYASFPQNIEVHLFDGVNSNSRVESEDFAGPNVGKGSLRSPYRCYGFGRKFHPTDAKQTGDEKYCECYERPSFVPNSHSEKESAQRSSPSGAAFGRRGSVRKRVRQQWADSDSSPEPVVELFSSEEEEESKMRPSFADCNVFNKKKFPGFRSTTALRTEKIAYPSRDDPDAVEVHHHDLLRLRPMEFLNDTVIDFYIKYIQRPEVLREDHKSKFYFFNSFFYKKLSEVAVSQGKKCEPVLSKLRKWTKGTNIFEKEYLFIPIHDKWHWSLAIICHPGASSEDIDSERSILHLDSMSPGHKSSMIFRLLRMYLFAEWDHQADADGVGTSQPKLTIEDFSTKKVTVPQQENESDCGLFLLHYIECFMKDAPSSFKLTDVENDKLFGKNWFKPSKASGLRERLLRLLENLFKNEGEKGSGAGTVTILSSHHLMSACQFQTDGVQSICRRNQETSQG